MITNRFSSSGLASARVDSLARIGIAATARYCPRSWNDMMPFTVAPVDEDTVLPSIFALLESGCGGKEAGISTE
jgi:hypothetical protein